MRRLMSAAAAMIVLGLSATAASAEPVQVIDEGGVPISIAHLDARHQSALTADNPGTQVLDGGRRVEVWKLAVQAGQCVDIAMRSTQLDSYVTLLQSSGSGRFDRIADDNDNGGGRDAMLRATAPASAPLYIVAGAADRSGGGAYTLDITSCDTGATQAMPPTPAQAPAVSPLPRF